MHGNPSHMYTKTLRQIRWCLCDWIAKLVRFHQHGSIPGPSLATPMARRWAGFNNQASPASVEDNASGRGCAGMRVPNLADMRSAHSPTLGNFPMLTTVDLCLAVGGWHTGSVSFRRVLDSIGAFTVISTRLLGLAFPPSATAFSVRDLPLGFHDLRDLRLSGQADGRAGTLSAQLQRCPSERPRAPSTQITVNALSSEYSDRFNRRTHQ
jgi:hypothetical protein